MPGSFALLNAHLLLSSSPQVLDRFTNEYDEVLLNCCKDILAGKSDRVILETLKSAEIDITGIKNERDLLDTLQNLVRQLCHQNAQNALVLGVALLQMFVQTNYTGPAVNVNSYEVIFGLKEKHEGVHKLMIQLLSVLGHVAYELCSDPVYLILSILLFEEISGMPTLFMNEDHDQILPSISATETPSLLAFGHWWRARALLVQISLLAEPTGLQPMVASSILSSVDLVHALIKDIPKDTSDTFKAKLYTIYYLENVKCSLAVNTEHLCLPSLLKVQKLRGFQLILTGARARRTKYQQKAHAGLIILACSSSNEAEFTSELENTPQSLELGSDFLLEKPFFESIGNEPLDEQVIKRRKYEESDGFIEERILPVALRQEDIPLELKNIDPNNQPQLSDYDNIQLLLRLYTIRQSSPAHDPLVEEELMALVSRILYQEGQKNWGVFSRALWERSVIETTKAKTIERGILQMQSLVEEFSQHFECTADFDATNLSSSCYRLKYIHQLPLVPRWALDAILAEKYMSMGIIRSAIAIYERLQLHCEAALCYAAVGDEQEAEKILQERIQSNHNDARAYSILGDIRQDPALWEKSWEIGKYVNAKNSLGRYYYSPPSNSNVAKDLNAALKHLNDSLKLYPLSFDTWYFYGCIGLECGKMALAAEAFSRCVSLNDSHALSWSNLSAAYIELGKLKEAHSCLKKAISSDAQRNWRIWENYMLVSMKLNEWDDVLLACKHVVDIRKEKNGEAAIDLPVVEKLMDLLIHTDFPTDESTRLTHFQNSCMELICVTLPSIITTSPRFWRIVARVELWRRRPYAALECHEKAYRAISHNPDLEMDESIWNNTVEACEDLVSAYESLGEQQGRHGGGDLVCKDWKYKARSTIKSLMSRGRNSWENSDGWERLLELRGNL